MGKLADEAKKYAGAVKDIVTRGTKSAPAKAAKAAVDSLAARKARRDAIAKMRSGY